VYLRFVYKHSLDIPKEEQLNDCCLLKDSAPWSSLVVCESGDDVIKQKRADSATSAGTNGSFSQCSLAAVVKWAGKGGEELVPAERTERFVAATT
jgi:hypothetical protein